MHFMLFFKVMYLNACGRSVLPKRVACVEKTKKIRCVWLQQLCQLYYNTPQRDEHYTNNCHTNKQTDNNICKVVLMINKARGYERM